MRPSAPHAGRARHDRRGRDALSGARRRRIA